ncbi:MAG: tetratricopeptide repeat protein [Deltaproteobacteria bacterium]|nr:tetratricopeptide repeat protein [Deltaproteobacteria bacterium]
MARNKLEAFQVLLAAVLVLPVLALGAVHAQVLAVLLVAGAALTAGMVVWRKELGHVRLDLPLALFLTLAAFTLLQIAPLPAFLVRILSPESYDVRRAALAPLGLPPPSFMPLSLDVALTLPEVGKLLLYASVYVAAFLWTRRRGSGLVLNLVVAASGASAAVFLTHKILLLDAVYGFYKPLHLGSGPGAIFAPLMNANHLSAVLGMGATVAVGLALATRERIRRTLLLFVAALIGGALLLTLSRGGIAAFVAGQCLFVMLRVIHRLRDKGREARAQHLAWLPLGLALSLGLGFFVAQDAIVGEFVNGDVSKLDMMREGLPLIGRFPGTGVGRGAFWVGFPLVSELASRVTFTHAENAIIQLLADWGVLFGGAALAGFVFVVARGLWRPPERVHATAALAALIAFGLHNMVDFNMEVPGVAILAAALLGVVEAKSPGASEPLAASNEGRRVPTLGLQAVAVVLLALAPAVGLWVAAHNVDSEERALRRALDREDGEAFAPASLKGLLQRHPASWYVPFLAGVRSYHTRVGNPLPWLGRAAALNPSSASVHFYVGRVLLRGGRLGQALLEYRLASRWNPSLAGNAADELTARLPRFEPLSTMAVTHEDRVLMWDALASALARRGKDSEAEAADKALLSESPTEARAIGRHALRLAGRGDLHGALALTKRLAALPDHQAPGAMLEAEIRQKSDDEKGAAEVLERAHDALPQHPEILSRLAWARQRAGNHAGALAAAAELRALAADVGRRAQAEILEGTLEQAEGRVQAAMAKFRQAYAMTPSDTSLLVRVADLAEQSGDLARALDALRRLVAQDSSNAAYAERLKRIEDRARGSELGVR